MMIRVKLEGVHEMVSFELREQDERVFYLLGDMGGSDRQEDFLKALVMDLAGYSAIEEIEAIEVHSGCDHDHHDDEFEQADAGVLDDDGMPTDLSGEVTAAEALLKVGANLDAATRTLSMSYSERGKVSAYLSIADRWASLWRYLVDSREERR